VLARVRAGLPWQPRMVAGRVPAALEGVCLTAMEREPAERYRSAAELAREVERWMAGARVRTNYVEPKGVRLVRWMRSGRGLMTLAGLILLSLGALAVAVSVIYRERQYVREDAERAKQAMQGVKAQGDQMMRQRSFASDELTATTRALADLAAQAQDPRANELTHAAFKELLLRKAHEGARRVAFYADRAGGTDLAAAHDRISLGELFLALGHPEEARPQFERAVLITRAVAAAEPEGLPAQNGLFLSARGLGQVQTALHEPAAARLAFQTALGAAEAVAKAEPNNPAARRNVAGCYEQIGDAGVAQHDVPAAREAFTKLVALVEDYAKDDPQGLQPQLDLANACVGRGKVEQLDYRFEDAISWYDRGTGILRALVAAGKITAQSPAAKRGQEVKQTADDCRDILKAVADINYALQEREGRARLLLVGRAAALARRGRPADAAATAEKLRGLGPEDGRTLYDVACCYAMCVAAVGRDKPAGDLTDEEKAARAEYAARAVKDLRAAWAHGFRDVAMMESDFDLDPLRPDPGYRAFAAELRALRAWLTFPVLP
jgi:tetratricopeptide (TPR) repeat protein